MRIAQVMKWPIIFAALVVVSAQTPLIDQGRAAIGRGPMAHGGGV
jgi:hypothetical protein